MGVRRREADVGGWDARQFGDAAADGARQTVRHVRQIRINDRDGRLAIGEYQRRRPEIEIDALGAGVSLRAPERVSDPDWRRGDGAANTGLEQWRHGTHSRRGPSSA